MGFAATAQVCERFTIHWGMADRDGVLDPSVSHELVRLHRCGFTSHLPYLISLSSQALMPSTICSSGGLKSSRH